MAGQNRKPGTIRVGDEVIVIATGQRGKCTSRPGSMFFVNLGEGEKGRQFAKEELKKMETDKSQVDMFGENEERQ
ncbi:MAG: hypothetical protein H6827_09770 [Planctomycetes bacterium]|nr:hypothetical protein [Planctomycetota bacterium]